MMNDKILVNVLKTISLNPNLLDDFSLPNINFPTLGGHIFWNNLAEYNGWKIQMNTITQHCRILDPDDIRRAWGELSAMERLFKKLADSN